MVGRVLRVVLAGALVLALLAPPPAQAQLHSCGQGLQLFIRNPDIVADGNGIFHVSGRLLLQFQVIGAEADKIEAFGLSFGLDLPTAEEVCALPSQAWATGVYPLEGYAVDLDKSDGFFIAINSNGDTSPQYQLGVAVHGFDASHTEVARFWGIVDLDHCGTQPSLGCPGPDAPDFTMPWPILLPGDGVVAPVDGFVFEFNEDLSTLLVELNGVDVTAQLTEWTDRPTWDQDVFPDGGPAGLFLSTIERCSLPEPIHECGPLGGPAYQWTERKLNDDDIVRIVATDLKGNVATKEIHIGSSVAGGTIADGLPILQMTFDSSRVAVPAGMTATFPMILQNSGGGTAHPFAEAEVPAGWTYEWVPGHQPVGAGERETQELQVFVPENATPGVVPVRAKVLYQQGSDEQSLESALSIDVLPSLAAQGAQERAEDEALNAKDSPAVGLVAVLVLVLVALLARRR